MTWRAVLGYGAWFLVLAVLSFAAVYWMRGGELWGLPSYSSSTSGPVGQAEQLKALEALDAETSADAKATAQAEQLKALEALNGSSTPASTPKAGATNYSPPPPDKKTQDAQAAQLKALEQ